MARAASAARGDEGTAAVAVLVVEVMGSAAVVVMVVEATGSAAVVVMVVEATGSAAAAAKATAERQEGAGSSPRSA